MPSCSDKEDIGHHSRTVAGIKSPELQRITLNDSFQKYSISRKRYAVLNICDTNAVLFRKIGKSYMNKIKGSLVQSKLFIDYHINLPLQIEILLNLT